MEERKFVPGTPETEKVPAKKWVMDYGERLRASNEEAADFVERIELGVNEDAKLSVMQRKFLIDAIGAGEDEVGEMIRIREATRIATYINSCR